MRPPRTLAAVALAAAVLSAAPAATAASPRPAPPPAVGKCGGTLADYVGDGGALDAAFTGMLNDGGTLVPFTLTPEDSAGVVRAEFDAPDGGGPQSVESAATVSQDRAGGGGITFLTPHGTASSDEVACGEKGFTRATEISGTVLVGRDHLEVFVLTRHKKASHPSQHSTTK